jgi:hypothetical protein
LCLHPFLDWPWLLSNKPKTIAVHRQSHVAHSCLEFNLPNEIHCFTLHTLPFI